MDQFKQSDLLFLLSYDVDAEHILKEKETLISLVEYESCISLLDVRIYLCLSFYLYLYFFLSSDKMGKKTFQAI